MKLFFALAGLLLWASPLLAESYSWVDENGTYNFTEDYSRVPKKYRKSVGKRGDMTAAPVQKEATREVSVSDPKNPSTASGQKAGASPDSFGGKTYDQWKQDFSEREAAMLVTGKRVQEIDKLLKSNISDKVQAQSLVSERKNAVEQYNEMKKQYDQQVESARKAGMKIEITQ